ncbi:type II secretion system protein, partial [Elusimicrobiota bacterium]
QVQQHGRCPKCGHPTEVFVGKKSGSSAAIIVMVLGGMLFFGIMIIGILAAIAIPKFADLIRKSNEGATKGNLGAVRSALAIYYGDLEGRYPQSPEELTVGGKYLTTMPKAKTPNFHADSARISIVPSMQAATDEGGWAYVGEEMSQEYGSFFVNCTHTDSKGRVWSEY